MFVALGKVSVGALKTSPWAEEYIRPGPPPRTLPHYRPDSTPSHAANTGLLVLVPQLATSQ